MNKKLGKIKSIEFGLGGYQEACIGLSVSLIGEGWGGLMIISQRGIKTP